MRPQLQTAEGWHLLRRLFTLTVLLLACFAVMQATRATEIPWISVKPDGSGFALSPGGRTFVPWGFNYLRDDHLRLLTEYWNDPGPDGWAKVERDFRVMKRLGTNVVRVDLQLAAIMDAPGRPDPANLQRLDRLISLAESLGIYLDLTGLGTFRATAVPAWYDGLSESGRWAVQAQFWEAVAGVGARHAGVFAYNLMNEPLVSTERRPDGEWTPPLDLDGLRYVEYLDLDPAGRSAGDILRAWAGQMRAAIHRHDGPGRRHLVTLGLIWIDGVDPRVMPTAPSTLAPAVDFFGVHIYPAAHRVDLALAYLAHYKLPEHQGNARPVLIEETFPLHCSPAEYADFLRRSRTLARGWLMHFWSLGPEDLRGKTDAPSSLMRQSLEIFQSLDPNH